MLRCRLGISYLTGYAAASTDAICVDGAGISPVFPHGRKMHLHGAMDEVICFFERTVSRYSQFHGRMAGNRCFAPLDGWLNWRWLLSCPSLHQPSFSITLIASRTLT